MSQQYNQLLNEVKSVSSIIDNPNLLNQIENKANDSILHIMLYGAYNAGKSTLVNAILGEEKAKVEDIPTTDSVDYYNWNGMKLLDTPGVNAPIQHQEITETELTRSSVILFVIREGDLDSKDVYDRLINLLLRNKKIFIVLNHQLQNQEKMKIIDYVRDILVRKAIEQNIQPNKLESIGIIAMNLRSALNGRLSSNEKLLSHSGFNEFISEFNDWLTIQNTERERFNGFKNYVNENWYLPALDLLQSQLSSQDKNKIEKLEAEKLNLQQDKRNLLSEVSSIIREQIIDNKIVLFEALNNSKDEFIAKIEMEKIFSQMSSTIEEYVKNKLVDFSFQFSNTDYSIEKPQNSENNILTNQLVNIAKGADEKTIRQALSYIKDFKIPLIKSSWIKALNGWAGKVAVGLQVVLSLWEVISAADKENKYNEEQRRYVLQLHQVVEKISTNFSANAFEAVKIEINRSFDQAIEQIQLLINQYENESEQMSKKYTLLSQSQTRMFAIEW